MPIDDRRKACLTAAKRPVVRRPSRTVGASSGAGTGAAGAGLVTGAAGAGLVTVALSLLALAAGLAGCADGTRDTPGRRETAGGTATARPQRLTLAITPRVGDAPLAVRLEARLEGGASDVGEVPCPSLAWDFGNSDVLISQAQDCGPGGAPRAFAAEYVYRAAGAFEASVRLLASDVDESAPVQVLVRGPTATPPPAAAAPGPTIIIATPVGTRVAMAPQATGRALATAGPTIIVATAVRTRIAAVATAAVTGAATMAAATTEYTLPPSVTVAAPVGTRVAVAPATEPSGAAAGGPASTSVLPAGTVPVQAAGPAPAGTAAAGAVPRGAAAAARVLPADLYYVWAANGALWRLPGSGGAPEPLPGVPAPVTAYHVSPAGLIASTSDGALTVTAPGSEPRLLAASGASAPLWSRDGRQLAYAADGVWVLDMARNLQARQSPDGEPLAWSANGDRLLVSRPSGRLAILDLLGGTVADLPLGTVDEAGWLPDRDVAWLAGGGLRLVAFEDAISLLPVIDASIAVLHPYVRPDLRLLAMVAKGDGFQPHVVDMTAPAVAAVPAGTTVTLPAGAGFAWAPDGRTAAVASSGGLELLDPMSGARAPLVTDAVRAPQWLLRDR